MSRTRIAATLAMTIALTAATAAAALAQDEPVTLRFAVSDFSPQTSGTYARRFVDEVTRRSGGSITIETTYAADRPVTDPPFEEGVAQLLVDGEAEIALVASRGWAHTGISNLQALQTPFLLTDTALAAAVSDSPIAEDLLGGMAEGGVTGLALWPEGMRYPIAFAQCGEPLLAPDDFEGRTIRAIPSAITWELFGKLGASPLFVDGDAYPEAVEACTVSGVEQGLGGPPYPEALPTATGDLVLYPKFQVLATNRGAFEHLSDAQQQILRDAAIVARDEALATQPSETELAAIWCAGGGRVVLAGADNVAAIEAALGPLTEGLPADPQTAATVDAIRELAATTTPAPGVTACEPPAVEPSASPTRPIGTPASLPPEGTWRVSLTDEEMLAAGATPANQVGGVFSWTFAGSTGLYEATYTDGGTERCEANMQPSGDLVLFVYSGRCAGEVDSIQWFLDDQGLHLSLVAIQGNPWVEWNKAYLETKPWQRVD